MRSEPRPSNPLLFRPKPKPGLGFRLLRWFGDHVFLVILGLPILLVGGCMTTLFVKAGIERSEALDRARALPPAEREKILRYCVEVSRQIGADEHDEREFGNRPGDKGAVPAEFAALQPRRVRITKSSASIRLHAFRDDRADISVEGLNGPTPSATLLWGELLDGNEAWASLKGVP